MQLLLDDYAEYAKHARLMTSIHAQPKRPVMPLTASGANAGSSSGGGDAKKDDNTSPAKKAKPEQKVAAAAAAAGASKVKKSLKRL